MTGIELTIIIIGILGIFVLIIRYNTEDPFKQCGRRVYAEA